ncbi:uncharacterized protein TNIN_299261 [Trichonephila inaurata madagascariensis]|uniref:DUF5641 domain-containing protein n=1 Tax=Trichonephila inaurata madagascariensis TaxID=2747483 RepID=A0A8X6XET7_9ARAC|nr:uncharacterized protein TNIN_299261 [Trichonephila inaurata madagascariensis]
MLWLRIKFRRQTHFLSYTIFAQAVQLENLVLADSPDCTRAHYGVMGQTSNVAVTGKAKPIDQLMSPLPSDRISKHQPFQVCGLVRWTSLRQPTSGSFQNFIPKHGSELHRQGKDYLEKYHRKIPWWGGFYERLVRSVKESLLKILRKAQLSFEEMTTILIEIEAVLNLRPLSCVYEDNDEPRTLTPMHFLNFGQNQPTYTVTFAEILENASTKSSCLKRKKYQQLLLKQLWHRWKKQYLLDLRTAHSVKNPKTHPELKVGDVVLIEEH